MHSRGFTLIELLVILTISAILVAMAVPSFQAMIQSNRISGASNSLLSSLDLARSEAIRRGNNVSVCRSLNPGAPTPACSSNAGGGYADDDWASGWIVFAKAPGNGANATVQADDEVLFRQMPFQPETQQRLIVQSTLPLAQFVTYTLRGFAGGTFGTFFVDYRDKAVAMRTNMAKCMAVNAAGRPQVAKVQGNICPAP